MGSRSKLFYLYIVFCALYTATFLVPRQISSLPQLSYSDYLILGLTVLVPQLIIWYVAFYGYAKLKHYSLLIKGTNDGRQVAYITSGILLLALSLPVNSILSGLYSLIESNSNSDFYALAVVKNYIMLLLPLAGFVYISRGAHGLSRLTKRKPRLRTTYGLTALLVIVSVIYCYAMFTSPNLDAIYHMPDWLVALTIVAPYLFTWFIGIVAAYKIHLYGRNAPGKLYQRTWTMLATGIGSIVVMQTVVQYVSTITLQFSSLQIVRLFITIYILLAALALGYALVAIGAKRLQKIEEV